MVRRVFVSLLLLAPAWAQTKQIEVKPSAGWIDTGVDLFAGDSFDVSAIGQLRYSNAPRPNGPEGLPRRFRDMIRTMPVNDRGRGALVGRIGNSDAARPFFIGEKLDRQSPVPGRLFIAVNQTADDEAIGAFRVTIGRTPTKASIRSPQNLAAGFPQDLLDSIPRRASNSRGELGDRTNFILIGSEELMRAALKSAGWVMVDRTKKEMMVETFQDSIHKEAYITMPMSELRLWSRPQDYGYAQGDPVKVIRSRHHFRLWRAPLELADTAIWVGAGTHDIALTRNPHNQLLTHKIDPNTDAERDYIRDSLMATGMVSKTEYLTPANPVKSGRTATGEDYTSDGRTLVVYLSPLDDLLN